MRWQIVRLIWLRELRDQLRDRRTMFMIVVLPLLLYPVLGFGVLQFAVGFRDRDSVVGFVREPGKGDDFPQRQPPAAGRSPMAMLGWLAATPSGIQQAPAAAALVAAGEHFLDYPLLIQHGKFVAARSTKLKIVFLDAIQQAGDEAADLVVSASPDFFSALTRSAGARNRELPSVEIISPRDDDRGRQAYARLLPLLENWKSDLKKVRLARMGLPRELGDSFVLRLPGNSPAKPTQLFILLIRVFPFMLVMWSLAGALYPAVDLCAGEKERGTMETLLISPAAREEIVLGKFLTIWLFSFASSLMNLVSMGMTTIQVGSQFFSGGVSMGALLWCVLLALPLSALFSAVSLAIGAYARSSKEGQYYLMPLFIITIPLVFVTLAPGVELSPFYSLVPVTGVALLMQRLMTAPTLDQVPWLYFIPVLAPIALYSWLALRWAIFQFQREEVLFREAERLDLVLWLRRLFRDKEPLPTAGQVLFCFTLIMGLRWLSLGLGTNLPAPVHAGVSLLAFVAAPALLMVVMLNTQPAQALRLRWPQPRELAVAAALALLFLPPLAWLIDALLTNYPNLPRLLADREPQMQEEWAASTRGRQPALPAYLLVFGLLGSLCEELAFRGFMLSGLLRVLRPRNAILLCALLFALYHMNVFQFLPAFFLGVVLGLLTVRSNSLLPPVVFHLLHHSVLIVSLSLTKAGVPGWLAALWPVIIAACMIVGFTMLWRLYRAPYRTAA